jgi:transcriptional regulator NrdR family protein
MVCIHCGQKTQVINSRTQRRANQVWRRRRCVSCQAVFSTLESTDYGAVWLVRGSTSRLSPFSRDKLFLSLHKSCQHRPTAASDAGALAETVIGKLSGQVQDGVIPVKSIAAAVQVALARFDKAAGVHYQAFHQIV